MYAIYSILEQYVDCLGKCPIILDILTALTYSVCICHRSCNQIWVHINAMIIAEPKVPVELWEPC